MPNHRAFSLFAFSRCMQNLLAGSLHSLAALGLALMTAMTAMAAQAATQAPTKPPHQAPIEVQNQLGSARLLGSGTKRFLGLGIYEAALWSGPNFSAATFAETPFALELTYLRSLDGKAIAKRSLKEMHRGQHIDSDKEQRWLAAMHGAFPDVKAGDRITGFHIPGVGASFVVNGQQRHDIADPEFSRRFFGIWLEKGTSEPKFRRALLEHAAP